MEDVRCEVGDLLSENQRFGELPLGCRSVSAHDTAYILIDIVFVLPFNS